MWRAGYTLVSLSKEHAMNAAFTLGRVALVVIFVFSGVQKLFDISGTADQIQAKLIIPAALGMPIWQVLAIVVALVEIVGGLLITFNVLTRGAAVVLLLFTAVTTFYYHDFWNMAGADRTNNLNLALKNLSIIGAFLMLAAWPRRVVAEASGERMEAL
jgi:putative oxidoreductase